MKTIFATLLAAILVGCDNQTDKNAAAINQRIQALEANNLKSSQQIQILETDVKNLKSILLKTVTFIDTTQNQYNTNYEQRLQNLEFREQEWILLDPTTKSYQRIDTSIGSLLVSVKSVTPYLDGYKVALAIGNPYAFDFNGFNASCRWGISFTYTNGVISNYEAAQNSEKSKDFQQTDTLLRGYWNPVELIISPATADEIKNLRISIKPNTISLLTKPEPLP